MHVRSYFYAATAALTLAASASLSAQSTSTGVIIACVSKTTGVSRIVPAASNCGSNENVVTWNQAGPQGATGPQGSTGQTGPAGPTGPTGATGAAFLSAVGTFTGNLNINNVQQAAAPITGASALLDWNGEDILASGLHLPATCSTVTMKATLYQAPAVAGSITVFEAYLDDAGITHSDALQCSINTSSGNVASCTTGQAAATPTQRRYVAVLSSYNLNSLKGGRLVVDTVCQ